MWPNEAWVAEMLESTPALSRAFNHLEPLGHAGAELAPLPPSLASHVGSPNTLHNTIQPARTPFEADRSQPNLDGLDAFENSKEDRWSLEHIASGSGSSTSGSGQLVEEAREPLALDAARSQNAPLADQHEDAALHFDPSTSTLSSSLKRETIPEPLRPMDWHTSPLLLEYPRMVRLPDDLRWEPTPELASELLDFFETHFETHFEHNRHEVKDLTSVVGAGISDHMPKISQVFSSSRVVYVFKLPTRPVLVTFHTKRLFNEENPYRVALALWTIDHDSTQPPVLSLRAVLGIKETVYVKLRKNPGKAVYKFGPLTTDRSPEKVLWLHRYH